MLFTPYLELVLMPLFQGKDPVQVPALAQRGAAVGSSAEVAAISASQRGPQPGAGDWRIAIIALPAWGAARNAELIRAW